MSYVFSKPTVCGSYPAIGGGSAYDADAFAAADDSGRPTGGSVRREDADVAVSSVAELNDDVAAGTTIWIESDAVLDAGSRQWTFGAADVTIASGRGLDGSDGALIRTDQRVPHQFQLNGDGCRVTGVRFEGPEPDSFGSPGYDDSGDTGEAISVNGDDVEIDNCVARGYPHAAIEVGERSRADRLHIHHCDLVDNNSTGLGYGVTVFHGHPLIRACFFDNNRHSVAGDGAHDCGWTTVDCIGGEHQRLHAWDMHEDPQSSGDAGTRMILTRSVLLSTHNWYDASGPSDYGQETVSIRAIPREGFVVQYNAFANTKPTEPMDDHDNDAFNVFYASAFSEGKVEGVDLNVYEWSDGDELPEGMGPTRETAVTGYDAGGKRDGSGGEDGTTDDGSGDSTGDSATMENPTSDRDGETYNVRVHGTGDQSAYVLVAAEGLREVDDSLEDNDVLDGRGMLGRVSTLSDTLEATGPIESFVSVRGPSDISIEIDGTEYPPDAFDCPEPTSSEPAEQLALGAVNLGGVSYDVTMDYRESGGSQ